MEKLSHASFNSKSQFKLPTGATIIEKKVSINVEEIENGFLINKSFDIKYEYPDGGTDWAYVTKKLYNKKNPLKLEKTEIPLEDKIK